MTTGAHEVTTGDKLQASLCWRRRSCCRTLDPQGLYAASRCQISGCQMTTGTHEVTTGNELQLHFARGRGFGGGDF